VTPPDDIRQQRRLVEQLRHSRVYREYERAFRECTGLPLSLHNGECFGLAHQGDPRENPFCTLMAAHSPACGTCLAFQRRLTVESVDASVTGECFAGLKESAVPVRVGDRVVAYLQTGQVLTQPPTPVRLSALGNRLKALGLDPADKRFAAAYARSRIVPRSQYEAMLGLLAIFAQQLGELSSQLAIREESVEQPAIARARAFITEHYTEELRLTEVARVVHMSPYHFCKSFHKSTGMTFTDFLARVRVDHVRHSLLTPHMRISEAAYAAGFQSLSQFSRVFRRITGESPSSFRGRLDLAWSA
jgi:AraC-like DNA-binding protein/ligand-binding sensor protein